MGPPPPARRGSSTARAAIARPLLARFDLAGVERWAAGEPLAWATLQPLLFDADALVAWRAAEALGRVAAVRAREDVARVREPLRRTLWLMNDESGGVLWMGPQVLGAALANVPALRRELLDVLASYLEEDPFRAGARWALWRVALREPKAVAAAAGGALASSWRDPDPDVRGHAALALAAAAGPRAAAGFAEDGAAFELFDPRSWTFRTATVGQAASGALGRAPRPG